MDKRRKKLRTFSRKHIAIRKIRRFLGKHCLEIIVASAAVMILLIIAYTAYIYNIHGHINSSQDIAFDKLEAFGSFVGGICGLLTSLLAVYLVLRTYKSQKEELEETRKIAREQSKTLKMQQFESAYFNMLKMLQEIVGSLYYSYISGQTKIEFKGIDYFKHVLDEYKGIINDRKKDGSIQNDYSDISILINEYAKIYDKHIYKKHSTYLSQYFRYIHNIMKYTINSSALKDNDKRKYLKIIQAQLSNVELGLVLYNSLSNYSKNKEGEFEFRKILDKYGILENIDEEWVLFDKEYLNNDLLFPQTNFFIVRNNK